MPGSSPFTINNFSPDFRDALLKRNLLADTVTDNSLSSWLDGINSIPSIGDGVGLIKGSEDIETGGPIYRKGDVKYSKITVDEYYRGYPIDYYTKEIEFPPVGYGIYADAPIASPTINREIYRDENTIYNIFRDGDNEYGSPGDIIDYTDTNIKLNTDYIDTFGDPNSPLTEGEQLRETNILGNQYKQDIDDYENVGINLLPIEPNPVLALLGLDPNTYSLAGTLETYTSNFVPESGPFEGGDIRKFNTTKNMYLDVDKQTLVNLDSSPGVLTQFKSYLDENGNLNYGKTESVQLVNVLGSFLSGGGVGVDPNSNTLVPDFDVRSSLAGRALTSSGTLNDTRLGMISPRYLKAAIGNNIAFNLQEETIGRINTNPLSLVMGGDLFIPNNKITVKKGVLGLGADILERMTGAKLPVSLLPRNADIFSYDTKGYQAIDNITRANNILENTGKGTAGYFFGNIKANINPNFLGKRQGYAPGFNDGSRDGGISSSDVNIYALYNSDGTIKDVLNLRPENSPIPQSSYNLEDLVSDSGFQEGPEEIFGGTIETQDGARSKFIWSDKENNKLARKDNFFVRGDDFKEPKSILFKTQELFNSGRMRTLVNGKGLKSNHRNFNDEINTIGASGFMSKGSAVLKNGKVGIGDDFDPDEMFARAWSPVDRYDEYVDLQKHSALSPEGRVDNNLNISDSVLGDMGVVQIGPYSDRNNIKRFMFSLENLAWSDSLTKLTPCEIGPGDPLTGTKGRIMWFPPYDITINESVSASYDRTNFIGRGEPIYTYNNTERTGTLAWKIVVDHPNYLNFFKNATDDEYAAFFAGALDIEEIQNRVLSTEEKEKLKIAKDNKAQPKGVPTQTTPSFQFDIFYPNDVAEVPSSDYEDGLTNSNGIIDYNLYPSGIVYEEGTTNIEESFGEGTTKGGGIVGTKGKDYIDNTNFGLNGSQNKIRVSDLSGADEEDGWFGFNQPDKYNKYFIQDSCKYCKIVITGFASPQGNTEGNKKLALARANKLAKYFKEEFLKGDSNADKRVVSDSEAIPSSGCKQESSQDTIDCKEDRKVTVQIAYDSELEKQLNPNPTKRDPNEPNPNFTIPLSRFYTECNYFESIKDTDRFVYSQFKDKIKNFHPAFHAITPEGFNSRLTFLQQCMRQGPTNSDGKADNLAFGRPPVCILRVGDFYHTKIIIESLTIDYEPIVWDLNPEGIGVQPMIANVNISFAFIGGSSMKGPINRLQNAISFNYFANTELYDPRAERIKDGEIVEGSFPYSKEVRDRLEKEKIDQAEVSAFEDAKEAAKEARDGALSKEEKRLAALENDKEILKEIRIDYFNNIGMLGFDLNLIINKSGTFEGSKGAGLSREYYGELSIKDSRTNELITVGLLIANPIDNESFEIGGQSSNDGNTFNSAASYATFSLNADVPINYGLIEFSIGNRPDFNEIMSLLNPCTFTIFEDVGESGDVEIKQSIKPCIEGDHMLILKWTDYSGFETSSKVVYLEDDRFGLIA
tara:strand:- start:148 stop:4623 length:4476 start_codon:yes stop_codon:yes gene_type:complete